MEEQTCFDCLRRRISADFSDQLIFSHAISDSALPFSSTAVVQMPSSGAGGSGSRFIVMQLPRDGHDCLNNYVNENILENNEDIDSHESDNFNLSEVNQDLVEKIGLSDSGKKAALDCVRNVSCTTCSHTSRFSCERKITALVPLVDIGHCSFSIFEKINSDFVSGSLEDHVLCLLSLLVEGKAAGRDSVNFLRLLGIPSFDENGIPGWLRHPNIAPVLGLLKSSSYINAVLPHTPYTLESILHYSPNALKFGWDIKFLVYQLLSALAYLHGLGVSHGNIRPSSIMLTGTCWAWLSIYGKPGLGCNLTPRDGECTNYRTKGIHCSKGLCSSQGIYADLKLSSSIDWPSYFYQWWRGELSNFEYLLVLNRLAGRRWADQTFHTVIPWVIDFSTKPDENSDSGWRDLSKSKWRLAKGDEQLDFTYSTSEIPHHVSDECLSELAVCSYKARRLPLSVLRLAVRSVYEPNEYPSTMQRLYQWTPDECIPEFYCDPQIFYSLNSGMSDLAVPLWASSPEEFVKLHRDALEGDRVSRHIHHWIDITFGYKMSGDAAVAAKNVMLPFSEPTMPRSTGRRQLFTLPHPARRGAVKKKQESIVASEIHPCRMSKVERVIPLTSHTVFLKELEELSTFTEYSRHLSPLYCYHPESLVKDISSVQETQSESLSFPSKISWTYELPSEIDVSCLLHHIEMEVEGSMGYQELLLWRQKSSIPRIVSEDFARDIFSVGCILAELYLKRPLFDSTSLAAYIEEGVIPGLIMELPPDAKELIEACIQKDWRRRPSVKSLLESPYFTGKVRSVYLFVAPLQLLAKDGSRLHFAASFAKEGALRAMGTTAAEMCAPYCLPLVMGPLSDIEAEWAYVLLQEFIKCLTPKAVKALVLPAIRRILQNTGYSHLKVSLLQDSFVQEIWNLIGKQGYLEAIHPFAISNLYMSPHKSSATVASVLLIGTSEELGVPITVHQTILPLIHCFGKGLCPDGIDVLIRIGGLLGESFIVRHMLPLLKQVVRSCVNVSHMGKPEPMQTWNAVALIDCLVTLDGLVAFLPRDVVVKELIEDCGCLHVMVLMQKSLEVQVLQVAATTLMAVCHRIGADLTALHVMPRLKELFDELAFSQETSYGSGSFGRSSNISPSTIEGEAQIESRMDLVLLMYPSFASLLGIEKLRQCCATWLLLEQFLLRHHHWKWEYTGESSHSFAENPIAKRPTFIKASTSDFSPAKLLLNGVGWSIPQSQGTRGAKNFVPQKGLDDVHHRPAEKLEADSNLIKHEPWFWFPSPAASWDGPDFLGRVGGLKDELPWKVRASVIYSVRAHHGALRSLAVSQDECMVYTAGVGQGFKGTVKKWEMSRMNCVSGYYGHEEYSIGFAYVADRSTLGCERHLCPVVQWKDSIM
ncbi:protein GFS12 isoform X2 [Tripterygium wilfordii]|uniref:protein GFS12 isoform X2 n=1 Tax=Tripterygium wilfordii TaxID=458696 RepID=UPI0018F8634F|nr:protein GFS12 isoform X2 [Tripterygium wilfordii]